MIPSTYTRREGAPKERELLVGRIIDRPIRPLFPPGFYHEVQVYQAKCEVCLFICLFPRFSIEVVVMLRRSCYKLRINAATILIWSDIWSR